MSVRTDEEIISDVLLMKQQGISVKSGSLLVTLYLEVYKKPIRTNCPQCIKEGYESLVNWANKRINKQTTNYMASTKYRFNIKYVGQTLPFHHKGVKYIVTQHNLTDDLAEIIKCIPKYAHVIEEIPVSKHKITVDVLAPKEQIILDEPISDQSKQELLPESKRYGNEGEQLEVVTASTSNELQTDGSKPNTKRGRPSKK